MQDEQTIAMINQINGNEGEQVKEFRFIRRKKIAFLRNIFL